MAELHPGFLLGLLAFLIVCSAFFSSSETGIISLNRYRLRHKAREGHRGAKRASALLSRPDRLLGTILIGNNFVNILASAIATVLAMQIWGEAGIAIATVALTIILLIFGEITPKTLAALRPEAIAYPASLPLQVLLKLFYPLVVALNAISNLLLRMFGIDPSSRSSDSLTTEELRSVVRESGHALPESRQNMLLGVLDLETVSVNDIMIPRNEIIGIDLEQPIERIVELLQNTRHTRLPVYRQDINQIEGMVHMRQLARRPHECRCPPRRPPRAPRHHRSSHHPARQRPREHQRPSQARQRRPTPARRDRRAPRTRQDRAPPRAMKGGSSSRRSQRCGRCPANAVHNAPVTSQTIIRPSELTIL